MALTDLLKDFYHSAQKVARPAVLGLAMAYCGPASPDDDREGCRDDNDCRDGRVCEYDQQRGERICMSGTTKLLTTEDLGDVNGIVQFRLGGLELSLTEVRNGNIPVNCSISTEGSNCVRGCRDPFNSNKTHNSCGCDGYWVLNRPVSLDVLFEYVGSDSRRNACERLPNCQYTGAVGIDQDGNFRITNLLVGSYNFTLRPDRVNVDFIRGSKDGQCARMRQGTDGPSHQDIGRYDTVTPPVKKNIGGAVTIYTVMNLAHLPEGGCALFCNRGFRYE